MHLVALSILLFDVQFIALWVGLCVVSRLVRASLLFVVHVVVSSSGHFFTPHQQLYIFLPAGIFNKQYQYHVKMHKTEKKTKF